MDTLTAAERSERMSRVRSKDTKPEMLVRSVVHGMGYRYKLHAGKLPGKPDLVFPRLGKVIFIHGCFWHRHGTCKNTRWPKSKMVFWGPKLEENHRRDVTIQRKLRRLGWRVMVVWECRLKHLEAVTDKIQRFLEKH